MHSIQNKRFKYPNLLTSVEAKQINIHIFIVSLAGLRLGHRVISKCLLENEQVAEYRHAASKCQCTVHADGDPSKSFQLWYKHKNPTH